MRIYWAMCMTHQECGWLVVLNYMRTLLTHYYLESSEQAAVWKRDRHPTLLVCKVSKRMLDFTVEVLGATSLYTLRVGDDTNAIHQASLWIGDDFVLMLWDAGKDHPTSPMWMHIYICSWCGCYVLVGVEQTLCSWCEMRERIIWLPLCGCTFIYVPNVDVMYQLALSKLRAHVVMQARIIWLPLACVDAHLYMFVMWMLHTSWRWANSVLMLWDVGKDRPTFFVWMDIYICSWCGCYVPVGVEQGRCVCAGTQGWVPWWPHGWCQATFFALVFLELDHLATIQGLSSLTLAMMMSLKLNCLATMLKQFHTFGY